MRTIAIPAPGLITDQPPRRRWRLPLSLKMFTAMMALLATGTALWTSVHAHRQRAAISEIERRGGAVSVRNTCPDWLRSRIPGRFLWYFDTAYDAGFLELETKLQDSELKHIADLTDLEGLAIAEADITDGALQHIAGLTRLERLLIWEPRVTDKGLAHFRNLRQLWELDLDSPNITDAGLEHLKSLPRLKRLILRHVNVSHAGVDELIRTNPGLDVTVLSAAYHAESN